LTYYCYGLENVILFDINFFKKNLDYLQQRLKDA
jgi:hypothetical protein